MYVPKSFEAPDVAFCHNVIREFPFALLITSSTEGAVVTHIPFLFDDSRGRLGTLTGHVSRANPHHELLARGSHSLVVFSGPHGYVSPGWYANSPAVPTWNYVAVHAHGTPQMLDDAATRTFLARLTSQFEGEGATAWHVDSLPEPFHAEKRLGIVAFEIQIEGLQGKAKLSQNRPRDDVENVKTKLRESPSFRDRELGEWMGKEKR